MVKARNALASCFLLYVAVFLGHESLKRPRVLILHSYYTDYAWVRDINKGFDRILKSRPYNIRYHYMDTKRHPQPAFMEKVGNTARKMIQEWQPDVIIAVDDNAQKYCAMHFNNNPHIAILFSGLNAELDAYGYDQAKNVSGIIERIPYETAHAIYKQVLYDPKFKDADPKDAQNKKSVRIFHLSDDSLTSAPIHKEIESFDWAPLEFVASKMIKDFDQWKEAVAEAEKTADCLLITHYHTILDPQTGKIMKPQDVVAWTEKHTHLPTLGFWGFFVEEGGMMAVGVSPYEQGEEPANMAVEILEKGIKPLEVKEKIPWKTNRLFDMYIRESSYKKRLNGQEIPLMLEAFSRATNHFYP